MFSPEEIQQNIAEMQVGFEENIERYGLSVMSVFGGEDGPAFTYTIGLSDLGWPELIITALPPELSANLLNHVTMTYLRAGYVPERGDLLTNFFRNDYSARLGSVSELESADKLCQAVYRQSRVGRLYRGALQIIMTDMEKSFPLDADYDSAYMSPRQPCLSGEWDYLPESKTVTAVPADELSEENMMSAIRKRRAH